MDLKKLIVFCVILANAMTLKAQIITENSTAEECVKFIENTAHTKYATSPNLEISFSGNELKIIDEYSVFIAHDIYHIPDWADFDKISVHEYSFEPGEVPIIGIIFEFKTENIACDAFYVWKDSQIKEINKKSFYNSILIQIPISEKDKIKDLEAAAMRLRQLALEHNGKLFETKASTNTSKIKNIEGKPTFDETVKFLNTYLEDDEDNKLFCDMSTYEFRTALVGEHFTSGKLLLKSNYSWSYTDVMYGQLMPEVYEQKKFLIDLSNVEQIKFMFGKGFEGGCLQVGLWFVEKGKSATPIMHLPLWKVSFDDFNADDFKESQIYRAFEHLRKLAGAPEPLNF